MEVCKNIFTHVSSRKVCRTSLKVSCREEHAQITRRIRAIPVAVPHEKMRIFEDAILRLRPSRAGHRLFFWDMSRVFRSMTLLRRGNSLNARSIAQPAQLLSDGLFHVVHEEIENIVVDPPVLLDLLQR